MYERDFMRVEDRLECLSNGDSGRSKEHRLGVICEMIAVGVILD